MSQEFEQPLENMFEEYLEQDSEDVESAYSVLCSFLGANTGEDCERMIDENLVPGFK